MPTKASRARRWVRDGKAVEKWNDAGVYYVQLVDAPEGVDTQEVAVGIDPGKSYSGIGVQSKNHTLYRAHLILPFQRVKERMGAQSRNQKEKVVKGKRNRALQRAARRGRRINRKVAFNQRNHRQKRFSNRRQSQIAPSIKAARQLELRVVSELAKIIPISVIVYEVVKADVDRTSGRKGAQSGKGFSPVMVGQYWALEQLKSIAPVVTRQGWQKDGNGTSQVRKSLGLEKDKKSKAQAKPETHAVDGVALAAGQFQRYTVKHHSRGRYSTFEGELTVSDSIFIVISRPAYFRRALHFDNTEKGGVRKRKGGTVTPFGFRSGDKVVALKAAKTYTGWVGGYTLSDKNKKVSVYDSNWKRLGQFAPSKVKLLRRSNKLCVVGG